MHETICINKKSLSLQDGGIICVSEIGKNKSETTMKRVSIELKY